MGIQLFRACEGRRIAQVHEPQGGAVGKPHAVADMIHPPVAHLSVGRFDAVFLHQRQVDVFHVGIVVGKSSVVFLEFVNILGVPEGETRLWCRLVDEFVFKRKTVDIAYHLTDPGSGDFVAEHVGFYFFGAHSVCATAYSQRGSYQTIDYGFHGINLGRGVYLLSVSE